MASVIQVKYLYKTYSKILLVAVNRLDIITLFKQRIDVNINKDQEKFKHLP